MSERDLATEVVSQLGGSGTLYQVLTCTWPIVELDGVRWSVAPRYIVGVGIGEAEDLAKEHDAELPSPALVDAIWKAADCKLDSTRFVRQHDGTAATMSSAAVMEAQRAKVDEAIEDWEIEHGSARLTAGYCKDVVRAVPNGKLGLYGWHRLASGLVIQPLFLGHGRYWKDYSQGARLVRKMTS